jgi:hypothetical protein
MMGRLILVSLVSGYLTGVVWHARFMHAGIVKVAGPPGSWRMRVVLWRMALRFGLLWPRHLVRSIRLLMRR